MSDTRFFFVHMQKTGGTSLFHRLRGVFDPSEILPPLDERGTAYWTFDVPRLVEAAQERGEATSLIAGHFPLCTAELLDGDFVTFTLLRDPVDRTLSFLRSQREQVPEFRDSSLEEVYATPRILLGFLHNHMVKTLGLTTEEMTHGSLTLVEFDDRHLERAKEALADRIDVFGVHSRYDDFCALLERRFGWDLGEPVRSNTTTPVAVSDEFVDRIRRDNRMDVELHDFAVELWEDRHGGTGATSGA